MRADKVLATGFAATTISLACVPLLGMRPAVFVVLAWVLAAVLYRLLAKAPRQAPDVWTFLLLAAPFLLMVLDLMRAADPAGAWHIAERSSILALAPFVVFVLRPPLNEGLRDRAVDAFALAAMVLALYANLGILTSDLDNDVPFPHRYRAAFAAVTGIQPPYGAYFFLCGALFLLDRALVEERHRTLRASVCALLFLAGMLIASRMPLLAFLVGGALIAGMRSARKNVGRAVIALVLLGALGIAVVPQARERMLEPFRTEAAMPTAATVNSVNERFVIGHCTLALLQEHWATGLGQAAVQPALDACYARFGDARYVDGSYSTHCQPLHWWLSFGAIGLLVFIALFAMPLRAAWQVRDARLAGFLVFFGLCCLTENVLARQWGVVPFAYFLSLLSPSLAAGARSARARSHT